MDVLKWWKDHEQTLPLLSRFARRVLAIPASSGKSERVFSTGGNFVTVKRTRLNAMKVQALIVIKENKSHLKQYLKNRGMDALPDTDLEGGKAFEKVKTVKKFGGIDSEDEISSDDEYYMDEN